MASIDEKVEISQNRRLIAGAVLLWSLVVGLLAFAWTYPII